MSVVFRVCAAFSALLSLGTASMAGARLLPKQYVIISFDGAHDLAQWERSRVLSRKTGANFTYFLSCVFLLSPDTRRSYQAPGKSAGKSNVGFAQSKQEVRDRLAQIWLAHKEGNEIASHGCGHFDGKDWSKKDWLAEFDAFTTILRDAYSINGVDGEPDDWRDFAENTVTGFRAPYLSTNAGLFAALTERGFVYDASAVSKGPAMPDRSSNPTRFALPQIPEGPSERRVIAMDYNLFVRHTAGIERSDTDAVFENRAYEAFRAAFETQYRGARVPLQLGFHFSLMNDGAYWRALERFAAETCTRADVACVSYRDYLARSAPPTPKKDAGIGG